MIFLRHPTPQAPPGLCYGRLDLAAGAAAEAEIARALDLTPPVARVIASPARRCRGLAEALAARDGVALELDDRLRELDFGDWENRRWWDIPRAESDPWAADPWRLAPPGGESFGALHARVAAVLAETGPGAGLVSHAGPIRAARMILTGASFAAVFAEPVPHAAPIRLAREPA
ncbi:MAG TPA: histidine phosphatase family protein [Thermohalobaculum sp.]|nr:histidine phosphatase family protein [Thermohalobaculum sp.]